MKMKIPKLLTRKKLRATTARRSLRASADMGYDEMSEPNMKLSRALLIVLVLHVVAVSGIIAFNAIKTRQSSFVMGAKTATNAAANVGSTIKSDGPNPGPAVAQKENAKPPQSATKSIAKEEHKTDRAKTIEHPASDSGKVYVVMKGDNPVTIAKKLKVPYDDLIALNHIEDPRKLQIGQKLLIPKIAKTKKSEE
jgi:LysM repeat protein